MNTETTATAVRAAVVTPKKATIWPNLSATSPHTEVLREAPRPERVPMRP
jgi:hypothetical protein